MDLLNNIFQQKRADWAKLQDYGFVPAGGNYFYETLLLGCGFCLQVQIAASGLVSAQVIDPATQEPYRLHLRAGAAGGFIGLVKAEYEAALAKIAAQCFVPDVFQSSLAKGLSQYVRDTYGDELEYLWQKFPENAVWRWQDSQKWYAVLLKISGQKLGLPVDEKLEIIDLRIPPQELSGLLDHKRYFPGYHMNKQHWYTMLLDGSVPLPEICRRLDLSYRLAAK